MATIYLTYEARYDKAANEPNGLVSGQGFTVTNRSRYLDPFGTVFWTIAIEAPVAAAAKANIGAAFGTAGAADVLWHADQTTIPEMRRI